MTEPRENIPGLRELVMRVGEEGAAPVLAELLGRLDGDGPQISMGTAAGIVMREVALRERYENALTAICTTSDSGPWIEVYRAAGGGYEGLQAIAEAALAAASGVGSAATEARPDPSTTGEPMP